MHHTQTPSPIFMAPPHNYLAINRGLSRIDISIRNESPLLNQLVKIYRTKGVPRMCWVYVEEKVQPGKAYKTYDIFLEYHFWWM